VGASLHSVQDCDDFRVVGDKVPGLCAVVGASCDDLDRGGCRVTSSIEDLGGEAKSRGTSC